MKDIILNIEWRPFNKSRFVEEGFTKSVELKSGDELYTVNGEYST